MEFPLPLGMDRSKATALGATLVLHVAAILWLLMLRFELPSPALIEAPLVWLPDLPSRPPPPTPSERLPAPRPFIAPQILPLPIPEDSSIVVEPVPDWYRDAEEVAGAIGSEAGFRPFGETPKTPQGRPKEEYPPSIYPKPLARVGTTYRTPEGELILWVSDHCFISLESQSLTMQDFHKARAGIRRCIIYAGKHKPRSDLFDHLKRPARPP